MPKFNVHLLHAEIQKLPTLSDEESTLVTSFVKIMSSMKESDVIDEERLLQVHRALMGFRLDWFRTCVIKYFFCKK